MSEVLSLWRSPLDNVAFDEARAVLSRQPRCAIGYDEDFSAMTAYNFGYFVTHYPASLDDALTQMFLEMSTASPQGGFAFVSQKNFDLNASSGGVAVPDQCNIVGSGGGSTLFTSSTNRCPKCAG